MSGFSFGRKSIIAPKNGEAAPAIIIEKGLELPPRGRRSLQVTPGAPQSGSQARGLNEGFHETISLTVTPTHAMLYPTNRVPSTVFIALRFREKNYQHSIKFKQGRWDGYHSLGRVITDHGWGGESKYAFPLGLLPKVIEACNRVGVGVIESPHRRDKPLSTLTPMESGKLHGGIELRDYQNEIVEAFVSDSGYTAVHGLHSVSSIPAALAKERHSEIGEMTRYRIPGTGLMWSATGSGKTVASASIVGRLAVRTLFMVFGNDLVRQTWRSYQHMLGPWLLNYGESVGIAVEGDFNPGFVTVAGSTTLAARLNGEARAINDVKRCIREYTGLTHAAKQAVVSTPGSPKEEQVQILSQIGQKMSRWLSLVPSNQVAARTLLSQIEELDYHGICFKDSYVTPPVSEEDDGVTTEDWGVKLFNALNAMERFWGRYSEATAKRDELEQYLQTVDLLICDEAHGAAASGAYAVIQNCPAYYRVGMSGTPLDRSDGGNIKVLGAFGEVSSRITNAQMREAGVIPDALIRMVTVPGSLEMEKGSIWSEKYAEGIVRREWRNEFACSRAAEVYEGGGKVLILFIAVEHGELLTKIFDDKGIPCICLDGSSKSQQRRDALDRFNAGVDRVLLASKIFNQGIDIPEGMDLLVQMSGGKGRAGKERGGISILQALGRGLRGGGDHRMELLDFMDEHHISLYKHSCSRLRLYKEQGCFEVREEKSLFI